MNITVALAELERAQYQKGHAKSTRDSYRGWVRDYALRIRSGAVTDFQTYLNYLADERKVATPTVKQALNAIVFFLSAGS